MYEESAPVRWIWVLAAAALGLAGASIWALLAPDAHAPLVLIVCASTAAILAVTSVMFSRYFVRFDGERLRFGFRGINKTLLLGEIDEAQTVTISPWKCGGWGWRIAGLHHIVYVCGSGPGVRIRTAARTYSFNCAEPDRLVGLLAKNPSTRAGRS